VTGVVNVLRDRGVLAGDPEPNGDPTRARNHLGRVPATDSGLFRPAPDLTLGQDVDEGVRLGTLYDPTTYEQLQVARADRDGVLYSLRREATVTAGSSVGRIAERL
jgi:predicted deacylase